MPKKIGVARLVETLPGASVTAEELAFLKGIERYQRTFNRRYPTWREVLFVAYCLGYRKVAETVPIPAVGEPLPKFASSIDEHVPPTDEI
jgi:hypothetical protein